MQRTTHKHKYFKEVKRKWNRVFLMQQKKEDIKEIYYNAKDYNQEN